MTYNTAAKFLIPWSIMALISGILMLSANPADAGASAGGLENFTNTIVNPQSVSITNPTLGFASNPVSAVVEYATFGIDWLKYLAIAATLSGPLWAEEWSAPIRYILLATTSPFLFLVVKDVIGMLSNFIRGLAGRFV